MIIVEGMDNSGKTTLVQMLSKNLQYATIPSTGPGDIEERTEAHLTLARCRSHHVIDRTPPISEAVYGPILRGRSRLRNHEARLTTLLALRPVVIYCRPPDSKVLEFNDDIAQMDGVISQAPQLLTAYDRLINSIHYVLGPSRRLFTYDYTQVGAYDRLLEQVLHSETDYELPFGFLKQTLGAMKV